MCARSHFFSSRTSVNCFGWGARLLALGALRALTTQKSEMVSEERLVASDALPGLTPYPHNAVDE